MCIEPTCPSEMNLALGGESINFNPEITGDVTGVYVIYCNTSLM